MHWCMLPYSRLLVVYGIDEVECHVFHILAQDVPGNIVSCSKAPACLVGLSLPTKRKDSC